MAEGRPVFHAAIGLFLAGLRKERVWSQQQAANRTKGRLQKGTLNLIEAGRIKHPDAKVLRALSEIYGISYESLAGRFVAANYGSGLIHPVVDQPSGLPPGGPHVATSARVQQLEQDNIRLRAALDKVTEVANDLMQIAAEQNDPEETGRPHRPKSGARRSARQAS